MGKKSKKQSGGAKAKGGANASSKLSGGKDTVGDSGGGGGILTSSGSSSKKQRCVGCLASLRDLAKAHQCPGCSLLYCWRCEKKAFEECPNGEECTHPTRRCMYCSSGETVMSAIERTGRFDDSVFVAMGCGSIAYLHGRRAHAIIEQCIHDDCMLSIDAFPSAFCGRGDCEVQECFRCIEDRPRKTRLLRCRNCFKDRCNFCSGKEPMGRDPAMCLALQDIVESFKATNGLLTQEQTLVAVGFMEKQLPDQYATCDTCLDTRCYECLDSKSMEKLAQCIVYSMGNPGTRTQYQCSSCYWSAKPCTNPNCPNKVGVPTKRCGGCHLDRYCSVECQAAAYPDHVGKCQTIQAKRTMERK